MQKGQIVKATAGFYYVDTGQEVVETKPRGLFRKDGTSPYVGDFVTIEDTDDHDGVSIITEIQPRKNFLVRPPLANLDYMVVVVSTTDPAPNYVTLDKLLATLEFRHIPAMLAITKTDLASEEQVVTIYQKAGYPVFVIDYDKPNTLQRLTEELSGKLSAFAGNSGVGKSTILNALDPSLEIEVGETSRKLGRGRHTTRHVEIYTLENNLKIADTPGFSTFDLMQTGSISEETLRDCFIDFAPYAEQCRFRDCRHMKEIGCAVREAVEAKEIARQRYESYQVIYDEIKDIEEWERR